MHTVFAGVFSPYALSWLSPDIWEEKNLKAAYLAVSFKDINETAEEKLLYKLNTFLFAASKLSISIQIVSGIRHLNMVIECDLNLGLNANIGKEHRKIQKSSPMKPHLQ